MKYLSPFQGLISIYLNYKGLRFATAFVFTLRGFTPDTLRYPLLKANNGLLAWAKARSLLHNFDRHITSTGSVYLQRLLNKKIVFQNK